MLACLDFGKVGGAGEFCKEELEPLLADLRRDTLLDIDADHIVELGLLQCQLVFDQLGSVCATPSEYQLVQLNFEDVRNSYLEVQNTNSPVRNQEVGIQILLGVQHLLFGSKRTCTGNELFCRVIELDLETIAFMLELSVPLCRFDGLRLDRWVFEIVSIEQIQAFGDRD